MITINLFGSPGTGKSTLAAALYAELKKAHIDVELAREYAKDVVYSKALSVLKDQVHILGEQHHRQWVLQDHCQVAITDSPILLCCIYNRFYTQYNNFDALALEAHDSFNNLNYVLARPDYDYKQGGRVEDDVKSAQIQDQIREFLNSNNISYKEITHDNGISIIRRDLADALLYAKR